MRALAQCVVRLCVSWKNMVSYRSRVIRDRTPRKHAVLFRHARLFLVSRRHGGRALGIVVETRDDVARRRVLEVFRLFLVDNFFLRDLGRRTQAMVSYISNPLPACPSIKAFEVTYNAFLQRSLPADQLLEVLALLFVEWNPRGRRVRTGLVRRIVGHAVANRCRNSCQYFDRCLCRATKFVNYCMANVR